MNIRKANDLLLVSLVNEYFTGLPDRIPEMN